MKIFDANISPEVSLFLADFLKGISLYELANTKIYNEFRIHDFFENNDDLITLQKIVSNSSYTFEEPRPEYGDFQTNEILSDKVAKYISLSKTSPEIVIEPTCGKGSFIVASLKNFKNLEKIFGIEIYKPYVWETKFNILNFYLSNTAPSKPEISISNDDVFEYDFKEIAEGNYRKKILIIGNPPWVTNSKLGSLNSSNLPKKTNFKKHTGLDAITGKGNFDIAEFITLQLINTFQETNAHFAFLIKNSVIKNIVFDQYSFRSTN